MTDKFLGCILSIKTKPSPTIQNIIGTVRKIELNPTSQALILDDAMANGTVLNDGFVVMSHQIADLQVIGKASDFMEQPLQKKNINFVKNDLNYSPASSSGGSSSDNSADNEEEGEDVTVVAQRNVTIPQPHQHQHYKIAKPKPRKIHPPPPPENNLLLAQEDFAKKIANLKVSEVLEKEKVGVKDFGRGGTGNSANLPNSKSTSGPAGTVKLGALSCFLPTKPVSAAASIAAAASLVKSKSAVNHRAGPDSRKHLTDRETFLDVDIGEILTEEFDFEQSNATFDKLPVQFLPQKPTTLSKTPGRDPKFTSNDTTHSAERFVTSTMVKNSEKSFLTDTGIAIPSVDLSTRSKILNLGHAVGLGHERMIESMARAVVQITLPLLGDGCRLSPERKDDQRPWVLVLAGPHWQGAVGIASARILTTLGVHTFIHSPKEELSVCAREEKLYGLSGEGISRRLEEIPVKNYDAVIHALDDHLKTGLTREIYSKFLTGSQTVFVDPPLLLQPNLRYKEEEAKVIVVCPLLPFNYGMETGVKFFVVNLGIPLGVYLREGVAYKSFYGDKLFVQVFGQKK